MSFLKSHYGDLTNQIYKGDIKLTREQISSLYGSPKVVNGFFYVGGNELTSLKYSPEIVNGEFDCSFNQIETLEFLPKNIKGYLDCSNNKLTSLKYSPKTIEGSFNCKNNNLITLKGRPKNIRDSFFCQKNHSLKNVKQQIIENGIKAKEYYTDEGNFTFKDIEVEFNKFNNYKKNIDIKDYGISLY